MVSTGGTEKGRSSPYWLVRKDGVQTSRRFHQDPIGTNGGTLLREVMRRALCAHELDNPRLPRKASVELTAVVSVPQTDSGGREEYSKALERTHPKELGKMPP